MTYANLHFFTLVIFPWLGPLIAVGIALRIRRRRELADFEARCSAVSDGAREIVASLAEDSRRNPR